MILRCRSLALGTVALGTVLAFDLAGCGGAGSEPTEAQIKEAMDYAMNHPPGETVSDPVKIVFFKKGSLRRSDAPAFPLHLRFEGRLLEPRVQVGHAPTVLNNTAA